MGLKTPLSVAEHLRVAADRTSSVLVVDDLEANGRLMERLLSRDGYRLRIAHDGQEALEAVAQEQPDVILMDVLMPKLDGFEACRRIKDDPATRLIPVVLVTALADTDSRIKGLEVGADDFISKPFSEPELRARVRSLLRIKHYTDELDSAESVILSLALTIEMRDGSTDGHCQRLAGYAAALGSALGLEMQEIAALRLGGFLHDIGKVGIPDSILLKPDRLTPEEYEIMKQHPRKGEHILEAVPLLKQRADEAGIVYSLAYGDQPALICEMVDWARAAGFSVVAAGKGTKYLPTYHASTPDTVWQHYGLTPEDAARGGMNAQMFNSFLDGTKSAIEMASVANATDRCAKSVALTWSHIKVAAAPRSGSNSIAGPTSAPRYKFLVMTVIEVVSCA